jgi:hypothetical protein
MPLRRMGIGRIDPRFLELGTTWRGQLHAPVTLPPGTEPPGTHWIGGWVGSRADLDDMEKLKFLPPPGLELRPLGRPACSATIYRLRIPTLKFRGIALN